MIVELLHNGKEVEIYELDNFALYAVMDPNPNNRREVVVFGTIRDLINGQVLRSIVPHIVTNEYELLSVIIQAEKCETFEELIERFK